ncbi:MAG: tetratricopeptide repeat protein, partial [Bacteroidota bacterium]
LGELKSGIRKSLEFVQFLEAEKPERLEERATTLLNLAYAYRELGHQARSDSMIEETARLLQTGKIQSLRLEAQYAHSLALNAAEKKGREAFCEANYQKALQYYRQVFGEKHKNLARVNRDYASLMLRQAKWSKADSLLEQAKASLRVIEDKRPLVIAPDWMVRLYELEGEVAMTRFQRTQDPEALEAAFAAYQAAIAQLNELNTRQIGEESLLRQRNYFKRIFQEGVRLGMLRYELDPQDEKWEDAFAMAEQSKAFLLRKRVGMERNEYAFGLPDSLRERELNLRREIAQVQAQLGQQGEAGSKLNRQLAGRMLVLRSRQQQLLDVLQSDYPAYYALRYAPSTIKAEEIQQRLLPGQLMLAYHLGDTHLQIFALKQDERLLLSEAIDV